MKNCVHIPENLWEKLKHKKSNENCERKIVDCFLNNVSSSFCSFCAESFGRTLRVNSKMLYYWKTCKLRDTSMLILSLNLAFALHRMRQFEYSQCHTTSVKGIFFCEHLRQNYSNLPSKQLWCWWMIPFLSHFFHYPGSLKCPKWHY